MIVLSTVTFTTHTEEDCATFYGRVYCEGLTKSYCEQSLDKICYCAMSEVVYMLCLQSV